MKNAAHAAKPPEGLSTALRRAGREKFRPDRSRKLREQMHEVLRYRQMAWRTHTKQTVQRVGGSSSH